MARNLAWFVLPPCLLLTGCPAPAPMPTEPLGRPMTVDESIAVINTNLAKAQGALKATGRVTVTYTDKEGGLHTEALDGKLIVLPPRHLRFDMTVFDTTRILLGSNDRAFWALLNANGERYRWGHHDAVPQGATSDDLPVRPDLVCEAVGLNPLPDRQAASGTPSQRLEGDFQQLLVIREDATGANYVEREYWVDRRVPRMIRQVIFRDPVGRVILHSRLADYRAIASDGPMLPHQIRIEWPGERGALEYNVKQWVVISEATTQAPSFRPPHELGRTFDDSRCVDDAWRAFEGQD